ncbi:hypothetical protein CAI21_17900 [Alkalilimnicola ehrlichii]|uniref:Short-chain dehydrogenase n=1 Tax=Alkalilimnicola ehrlichii TaxID=351052 RepID=A0A3E0WLM5_9GAMM|nr:SDR family oxidoreductase [Alkalilimnicola ehrlichii]RFA25834.1 hypothetical protein CAI21_17900 [Alkalilimnicola ehrlichii]RFA33113.1 hypothetical protein CAL65_18285 [Alkalilimnicola ehrlichii]
MSIEAPVALVTGASRGLGQAMSLALASRGWRLGLVARDQQRLEICAEAVRRQGGEAWVFSADLGQPAEAHKLAEQLTARYGQRLDLLVNNAGNMGDERRFEAVNPGFWSALLEANLTSAYLCCWYLLPALKEARGCIVNISSGAAVRTGFLNLAYGVAKAGLDRLTQGLAAELNGTVACVSLSPPVSDTETVRKIYPTQAVTEWAAPPSLTADALLKLLDLGPSRFNGQVVGARELLEQ